MIKNAPPDTLVVTQLAKVIPEKDIRVSFCVSSIPSITTIDVVFAPGFVLLQYMITSLKSPAIEKINK